MSIDADKQSPLERLRSIVTHQEAETNIWQENLPALRARTLAYTAVLREMTRHSPLATLPQRDYADVLIAAPDQAFAQAVEDALRGVLPKVAELHTDVSGVGLQGAPAPEGFIAKVKVSLPGTSGAQATAQVRNALSELNWIETDYSESIDLIVVSPPANGSTPHD